MVLAGAASKVINNEPGAFVQGAGHPTQRAEFVRDDLEANALFLKSGDSAVLLISCDIAALETQFAIPARQAVARETGVPERSVIIAGTHTHNGPSLIPTCYRKPVDLEYISRLQSWLVEASRDAVASARPARLGWGLGKATVGYNRRCCWADGTHSMFGDTSRADFTGMEGPDDPAHVALFAFDAEEKPIAVLHNNTIHPTSFYGKPFYSADSPGFARAQLREALGAIPVLFFNGAFGDISNRSSCAPRPRGESGEQRMMRAGHLLAGETLRLLYEAQFQDDPVIAHVYEDMEIPVRLPAPEHLEWARGTLARADKDESVGSMDRATAYGTVLLHEGFAENPVDVVPVHAIRIGDVAIATQPCELYCQFGLDIKRRSPAPITAVVGIADGYGGYCPTTYGIIGGGYSGEPLSWTRLAADAGYRITDTAARLAHSLWQR